MMATAGAVYSQLLSRVKVRATTKKIDRYSVILHWWLMESSSSNTPPPPPSWSMDLLCPTYCPILWTNISGEFICHSHVFMRLKIAFLCLIDSLAMQMSLNVEQIWTVNCNKLWHAIHLQKVLNCLWTIRIHSILRRRWFMARNLL